MREDSDGNPQPVSFTAADELLAGTSVRVRDWQLTNVLPAEVGYGGTGVQARWSLVGHLVFLTVTTDTVDGPVRVVRLDWHTGGAQADPAGPLEPSRAVTPAALRDVAADLPRLAQLGHAVGLARFGRAVTGGDLIGRGEQVHDEARRLARRRHTLTRQLLAEVARVYTDGGTRGRKAVAEHFGVPPRTASRWVHEARHADPPLLGPAPGPGKAGQTREDNGQ
jgi:hypothetical protein